MATITLRVPDTVDEVLTRHSTASGLSKSDLVREALRRYLAIREFRALRESMVPHAQARGLYTDEDIFQALDET